MSQAGLLRAAVALLDAAGIPYMVVGSYASTFHGEPRMTRDIDLVIERQARRIQTVDGHQVDFFVPVAFRCKGHDQRLAQVAFSITVWNEGRARIQSE